MSISDSEIAAAILNPIFVATRDTFATFELEPGRPMDRLAKVRFIVDPRVHNSPRHFAATRDDGLKMTFAPSFTDLEYFHVVAILAHEFGHAADFVYPAEWMTPLTESGKAWWVGHRDSKEWRAWQKVWRSRGTDQVEWAADGIAEVVTGHHIGYCGDCMLETFDRCESRPAGLR